MTPSFSEFLAEKPLYYKKIDHERIHWAYALIRDQIAHPPAMHIVGTNGKGSTGRMIAHLVRSSGFPTPHSQLSVGHYTSPHILRFNERIWIDGEEVRDAQLESGHRRLYGMLGAETSEALSYFEYTTLLALLLFEACDLVVLEAGLGGEYDATNVVENKVLSVITPIGIDHQAFLGETIEAIAATKLRSIAPGGKVLLAEQPYEEVVTVAESIAREKNARLFHTSEGRGTMEELGHIVRSKAWPDFLAANALTALRALEIVGIGADPEVLGDLELFGRFTPLTENIRIDVGHNPLAARAIARALEPDTVLIYNSLEDKEYREVLSILQPRLKRVELIAIESQRAAAREHIVKVLEELRIPWQDFKGRLRDDERYLVFGSFYTVEAFLKMINKGLSGSAI